MIKTAFQQPSIVTGASRERAEGCIAGEVKEIELEGDLTCVPTDSRVVFAVDTRVSLSSQNALSRSRRGMKMQRNGASDPKRAKCLLPLLGAVCETSSGNIAAHNTTRLVSSGRTKRVL